MATGMNQGGGVFEYPDVPSLGPDTWAGMTGVHPEDPLVGGRTGFGYTDDINRRVVIGAPSTGAKGGPVRAHYSELLNLKGNPIGWVCIAAIIYLGLAHISLHGSLTGKAGKARAGATGGFGSG